MLRWLFIALLVYFIYRMLTRDKRRQKRSSFTFHFGRFPDETQREHPHSNSRSIEQIEEAEFEDITEKEEKKDQT